MKRTGSIYQLPLALFLFAPLLSGADLSTYRGYQLGMTLKAAVSHSGMDPSEVTVMHKRPALIQELLWRPSRFVGASSDKDPVDQVDFSFFDGHLFRIVVDYDDQKIAGLTADDLIEGISTQYGAVTRPNATIVISTEFSDETAQVLGRWDDANFSFNLVQLAYSSTFKVVIFDKRVNARAETAVAEGIRLDTEQAPGLLKLQEQNAKINLDRNRLANKAYFRP
jgi:hypothetical protein